MQKLALAARERGVTLEVDAMAAATMVRGDIALLERVLDNLIDNALRHTPAGGRVIVQSEPQGEQVRIAVTDTGPGLTREESRQAFERFYRGDPGRSTHSGQSGLGLAIVKSILDLHGSDIAVDSHPGHGASFYFELPIVTQPARTAQPRACRAALAPIACIMQTLPRSVDVELRFVRNWHPAIFLRLLRPTMGPRTGPLEPSAAFARRHTRRATKVLSINLA